MDKTKKILFIIFLTLSIISLTFGLCKKVGLCASSEQTNPYYDDYPLPIGENIGGEINFTQADINAINTLLNDNVYYMLMYEITDSNHYVLSVFYHSEPLVTYSYNNTYGFGGANVTFIGTEQAVRVDAINHTASLFGGGINANYVLLNYQALESSPIPDYYAVKSGYIKHYPVYSVYDNTITSGDKVLFQPLTPSETIPPGHSKGGNISNYISVDDSNVDVSNVSPSSTNTTNFLQTITNFLQNLTKSTQNGFSNIVSNLQNFWNPILGWLEQTFDSLLDKFDSIIAFLTPPSVSDITSAWLSYYNNSALAKFGDLFSALNDIFIQIFNASAPDTLIFTYNLPSFSLSNGFGDSYILGRTITIDFGWYNNVRDTFISILAPLLYLSFFYMLFTKIPGIIGGSSGPVQSLVKTGKSK